MDIEKFDSSMGVLQTFSIKAEDVDDAFQALGSEPGVARDWILGLVNMTNECFMLASTTGANGQYGKWFVIPKTCRNCNTNYDDCSANNGWNPILSTACNAPRFNIRIATQPDQNGNANGAEFTGISPNCSYSGGLIGIY